MKNKKMTVFSLGIILTGMIFAMIFKHGCSNWADNSRLSDILQIESKFSLFSL
jgi:hypothetical protein